MPKRAKYLERLGDDVVRDAGLARFVPGRDQGKLGHLAAQLGDDSLGRRGSDAGQRRKRLGILIFDGFGHLAYRGAPWPAALS